ncbi:MAG: sigma-70 family RNA polymerase sigma factor [Candidatus Sericytochromatia bacterium]|jgi:RNA polymerase sigma-70 factor (ECF subfamily)
MQSNAEEELILRCQQGDKMAFAQLVRANQKLVFNLLYRLVPVGMDIDDLAQDVWVKVYQSIGKVKNASSFRTWLHRVALNTYYDKVRKTSPKIESLDEMTGGEDDHREYNRFEVPDPSLIPEDKLLSDEWKKHVEQKIQLLPEQYRIVLVMRDVQNLSYDEIAEITELSLGTVKSRLARAREKLVSELSDYFKDKEVNVNVSR